ncbi:unnamed protein product, partial [Brassica oleracea var. botrytis]
MGCYTYGNDGFSSVSQTRNKRIIGAIILTINKQCSPHVFIQNNSLDMSCFLCFKKLSKF